MIYIAILTFILFGRFETRLFKNTGYEEDFFIALGSYFIAGFLIVMNITGAW